jgi:hypothetical protein
MAVPAFSPDSGAKATPPQESTPTAGAPPSTASVTAAESPAKLTAEEQMALFAKELKENDWGHQPC